ncbi:SCO family protein [Curvibacter sp. CHRR-16]|uniref:SCO family protein n=1 Tax=Curvibacter sp. CHRR-16 TaxID=2835872 RepID=UPI0020239D60|nr:SCO family protein [Curvibacter sp. CHRR-16]
MPISSASLFSACSQRPAFHSIDISGAKYAQDFALTDHNGQLRHLAEFKGKVVVLFFGYTQCPDVCPTSMAELAEIKQQLGADGDKLQGLFVTLDPERDRPDMLKAYMGNFDSSFLALYTSVDKLPALAQDFRIYYKKVPGKTPTSYTLDHTAGSYVYDPSGKLRLMSRYGTGAQPLLEDVKLLLQGV